jgi:hypothetical protein
MAIFFKDPILSKIEDMLMERALNEIKQKMPDASVTELTNKAKDLCKALLSKERHKIKIALKEYIKIAHNKTVEAFDKSLFTSKDEWYSIEIIDKDYSDKKFPVVFVVPFLILKRFVELQLAVLLLDRIEFSGMENESILAFAQDASNKYFMQIIKDIKSKQTTIKLNSHNVKLVDIIDNDFYYLGDEKVPSRIDIVIFSIKDIKWWKDLTKNVDARPQGRRFTQANLDFWSLNESTMNFLKKI